MMSSSRNEHRLGLFRNPGCREALLAVTDDSGQGNPQTGGSPDARGR
jgi:hypothetical protein